MIKRGGGITGISLRDKTAELEGYYQLHLQFHTVDSMGANFINSCLKPLPSDCNFILVPRRPFSLLKKKKLRL